MDGKRHLKRSLLKCTPSKKQRLEEASEAENTSDIDERDDQDDSDKSSVYDSSDQQADDDIDSSSNSDSTNKSSSQVSETSEDICDALIDKEIQHAILTSKMSVYKLDNNRISGLNGIRKNNINLLRNTIARELEKNKNVKHKVLENDKSPPFWLTLFYYHSEQKKDFTTTQIAKDRQVKERETFKGKRDGGSIFVHYRFKGSLPEVFFLCSNTAFRAVLHLSDPNFRTQVAKHYMDGEHIKELETINIAGPAVLTKRTYREPTDITTLTSVYLEKAVLRLSGIVRPSSSLYKHIKEDKNFNCNLEIGMNVVKIDKCLSYQKWAEVLNLFSKELAPEVVPTSNCLSEAFDSVQRIDPQRCKELNNKLSSTTIDAITERNLTGDFHLSHRYTREWIFASSVTLSITLKAGTEPTEIKTWANTPTLENVVKEIHDYTEPINVKKFLKGKKLRLAYKRQGKQEIHPVQDFVHGHVHGEDGTCYKLGQKWYLLSSTFSQVVDRNFKCFADNSLLRDKEGNISELLPYPWNTNQKHYFTLGDVENYFDLSTNKAKKLIRILMNQTSIVDESGQCNLTESSCLLPTASKLYAELKPKEERKRKATEQKKMDQNQTKLDTYLNPQPIKSRSPSVDAQSSESDTGFSDECIIPIPVVTSNSEKADNSASDPICGELLLLVRKQNIPFELKNRSILRKTRFICRKSQKDEERFIITNPILTNGVLKEIRMSINKLRQIHETKVTQFLRIMYKLSEGEYNELYLHHEEKSKLFVIPGDRITPNGVELFDILIHDKSPETGPETYLFHCKEKFGNNTRDSCAQIRNSSELLWHDFRRGRKTHVEKFFDSVVSYERKDAYRILLKEKLEGVGKEKFLEMFEDNTQIIFVYAFLQCDTSDLVSLKLKAVEASDLEDFGVGGAEVLNCLKKEKFLIDGYLADSFISKTKIDFIKQCASMEGFKFWTQNELTKLYNKLSELGKCKLSTIAKLELLTLDNCFARYQIGGKRRFELKFIKIKSP